MIDKFVSSWMWCRYADNDGLYCHQDLDGITGYWIERQKDNTWIWFRHIKLDPPDRRHIGFHSFEEAAVDCEKAEKRQ